MDHEIVFSGIGGLTSGAFVRTIRQQAMAQGKQKDDQWMAQLAAGYLDGQALNWFEEQDEETQESWKLLRRGLLQRWNPEGGASSAAASPSAFSASGPPPPVPPAAPPIPAAAPAGAPLVPNPQGRIRALKGSDNQPLGYVSRALDTEANLFITPNVSDAMVFQFVPDAAHPKLLIPNQPMETYLGAAWEEEQAISQLQTHTGTCTLTPVNYVEGQWIGMGRHKGEKRTCDVYLYPDNTLALFFWMPVVGCRLFPTYRSDPDEDDYMRIFAHQFWMADNKVFMKRKSLTRTRLMFEPLAP